MPWFTSLSIFLLLTTSMTTKAQRNSNSIIQFFLEFIRAGVNDYNAEARDNNVKLLPEYDFIVIGAGTAGCTLAARLSENPQWKVLLLEAGGPELLPMDIPALAHFLQLSPMINWGHRAQPSDKFCIGMKNNRCNFPRGKVMGGSSVLNYMMYIRGNRRDFDAWAELGNTGWSYRDVLPYFRKFENSNVASADQAYVGHNGPVQISTPQWHSIAAESFVQAGQEDGVPMCDYNGERQHCFSFSQTTTNEQFRWSANRAYLYPLKGKRNNLHIIKYAFVTQLLLDPETKTAYGVQFENKGQTFQIKARLEVISSAGAINSPQLLMLSGIGPAKHLRDMGIEPLANLAVGFNLQDHFAPALTFLSNVSTLKFEDFFDVEQLFKLRSHDSVLSLAGGIEAVGFYELDNPNDPDGWPDMELLFVGGALNTNPASVVGLGLRDDVYFSMYKEILELNSNTFSIWPMILRPRSRGRILLRSKDPKKHPLIYPNYFHDPYDMNITIRGMQKSIELMKYPAMRKINARLLDKKLPKCRQYNEVNSVEYLECYARHLTFTIYHQSGTAKMGPKSDKMAVVDPRLRVHGIRKLRVIDASIMPNVIAGHTNAAVFMIAEKAADMIKQDYGVL